MLTQYFIFNTEKMATKSLVNPAVNLWKLVQKGPSYCHQQATGYFRDDHNSINV